MELPKECITALGATWTRAYHYAHDEPTIFDDPFAHLMLTESEKEYFEAGRFERLKCIDPILAESCSDRETILKCFMRAAADPAEQLSRARYTEDRLKEAVHQGIRQYVIVGAGMDTFAFRHPDLSKKLQVFEIDRPSVQTFKHLRISEAGLEPPSNMHFVPVDFGEENLDTALMRTTHIPQEPTFFSWMGVVHYLEKELIITTLRAMRRVAASGSQLTFDYIDLNAFDTEKASRAMQEMLNHLHHRVGDPVRTGFAPEKLGKELADSGFQLQENCSPQMIEDLYFKERTDGYHATEHIHFARAVVE